MYIEDGDEINIKSKCLRSYRARLAVNNYTMPLFNHVFGDPVLAWIAMLATTLTHTYCFRCICITLFSKLR